MEVIPELPNKVTISACMIVRNEEKYLGDALASIKDVVDEIVIVDTGSTDKTVEIAKSYGARVEIHPWKDDFSLHRNQSISMATKDWIMIFDADDRLFEGDMIREHLAEAKSELVQAVIINKGELRDMVMYQIRFIKRGSQFKYEGRIHNRIPLPDGYTIDRSSIRIIHIGYNLPQDERDKKHDRTKRLLEMEMKESPLNPYLMEHYAKHMRVEGKHKDPKVCLEYATKAASMTNPRLWSNWWIHLRSLDLMTTSLLDLNKFEEAMQTARQLLYFKPNHLDSMLRMAFACKALSKKEEAIQWFGNYIKASEVYDPLEDPDGIQVNFPNMQKMALAEIEKCKEKGADYYDKIYSNGYNTSRYNLIYDRVMEKLNGTKGVLEVGCGIGDLAKRISDKGIKYRGFDFSKEAIKQTRSKIGKGASVGDLYNPKEYKIKKFSYDTIVALEILEHVDDAVVLKLMPKGKRIIGSVPNFRDPSHLRVFESETEVKNRYKDIIDIKNVETFEQPSGKIFLFEGEII